MPADPEPPNNHLQRNALHVGTFGRVVVRFAPATFIVAVVCALAAGFVVFGRFR